MALGLAALLSLPSVAREPKYRNDMALQQFGLFGDAQGREIQVLTIGEIRPLGERSGSALRTLIAANPGVPLLLTQIIQPSSGLAELRLATESSSWYIELTYTMGLPATDFDSLLAIEGERDPEAREKLGKFPNTLRTSAGHVVELPSILGEIEQVLQASFDKDHAVASWLRESPPENRASLEWLLAAELADEVDNSGQLLSQAKTLFQILRRISGPSEVGKLTVKDKKWSVGRSTVLPAALELVSQFKSLENNDPLPTAEIDAELKRLAGQRPAG